MMYEQVPYPKAGTWTVLHPSPPHAPAEIWDVPTQQRFEWNTLRPRVASIRRGLHAVLLNSRGQPEGLRTPSGSNMAKVNSGASGCRAMVKAGKYLSSPSSTSRNTGQRQREMFNPQRRLMSAHAAGTGGKTAALAQQEQLGYFSTTDRRLQANRNLIYRDVKAFLNEVGGNPREARYWLTQFQRATSAQSTAFAVLEVG